METKIVSVQTQKNLSVVQMISSNVDTFDYLSLGIASAKILIELKEISDGGSVNDIYVINHSDKFVFIMDGDIIEGAKQNRIINTSVLLAPKSKTKVQVSCIEQGRWNPVSDSFKPSDYTATTTLRMQKNKDVAVNLGFNASHYADQENVWNIVSEKLSDLDIDSKTSNLSDAMKDKREEYKIFSDEFKRDDSVNGLALFKGNKLIGMDLFNSSKVYQDYFCKILKGAAMEFSNNNSPENKIVESEIKYKTLEIIDKIEVMETKSFKGIGVGTEERFEAEKLTGFQLIYDNKLIHLAAMNME